MKVDNETTQFIKDIFYLLSLAQDLDEKEKYYHGVRVALLSEKIAEEILPEEKNLLFYAGLLHDIGGLGSTNHLLHHPDLVEQIKNQEIFLHPYRGAHLIRMFPVLFQGQHKISDYIFEHHQWWKGAGYPRNMKGQDILLGARIIRAADAFDIYSRKGDAKEEILPQSALNILEINGEIDSALFKILKETIKDDVFMNNYYHPEENILGYFQDRELTFYANEINEDALFEFIGYVVDIKLEARWPGHSVGDVHYAVQIAQALNLDKELVDLVRRASYLHDIGKLAIPRMILTKLTGLTEQEWQIVRKHPEVTIEVLEAIPTLKKYAFGGYHHERWDGRGYPKGLKEEEIPLGARIIAVADALDAMTSERAYRPTFTFKEALAEIHKEAGHQFDPRIVERVLEIYK